MSKIVRALSNMSSTAPAWLSEMLQNESFLHYHSYLKSVRHNHKAHGAVAICHLGGTLERVQRYYDAMNPHVPVYKADEPLTELLEIDFIKSDKLEDYRGKNQGFYTMLQKYDELYQKKYDNDIMKMIKDVCPTILDGPIYSAFHGVIQIAYGMAGNNNQTILEGIVFMDQQYSPMFMDDMNNPMRTDLSKFGHGKTSMMDTLTKLRNDTTLQEKMNQDNKKDLQLRKDTHMFGVYGWPAPKYQSKYFVDITDDLKLPDWFDAKQKDMKQLSKLIDWLCDMCTVLYVESNTVNDFFILHGVTAAWSSKHVLPLFDFDTALHALRGTIAAIFVVYVTQGTPALTRKCVDFYKGDVTQVAWNELITSTLDGKDYETHVYKVIQCLYEFWKENPSSEYASYYLAGAYAVRDHPYGRGPNSSSPNDDVSM